VGTWVWKKGERMGEAVNYWGDVPVSYKGKSNSQFNVDVRFRKLWGPVKVDPARQSTLPSRRCCRKHGPQPGCCR